MTENIDWKEKYKQVKMRYIQLYNMRHAAVQSDIDNLHIKMKEHVNSHDATIQEIIEENKLLSKEISEIKAAQEDIYKLKQRIENIKNNIRFTDSILNTVLEYRFLVVKCIGPSQYRLHCVDNDSIVFELYKGPKAIAYRPIHIPNKPRFLNFQHEVQVPNLKDLCDNLQNILND